MFNILLVLLMSSCLNANKLRVRDKGWNDIINGNLALNNVYNISGPHSAVTPYSTQGILSLPNNILCASFYQRDTTRNPNIYTIIECMKNGSSIGVPYIIPYLTNTNSTGTGSEDQGDGYTAGRMFIYASLGPNSFISIGNRAFINIGVRATLGLYNLTSTGISPVIEVNLNHWAISDIAQISDNQFCVLCKETSSSPVSAKVYQVNIATNTINLINSQDIPAFNNASLTRISSALYFNNRLFVGYRQGQYEHRLKVLNASNYAQIDDNLLASSVLISGGGGYYPKLDLDSANQQLVVTFNKLDDNQNQGIRLNLYSIGADNFSRIGNSTIVLDNNVYSMLAGVSKYISSLGVWATIYTYADSSGYRYALRLFKATSNGLVPITDTLTYEVPGFPSTSIRALEYFPISNTEGTISILGGTSQSNGGYLKLFNVRVSLNRETSTTTTPIPTTAATSQSQDNASSGLPVAVIGAAAGGGALGTGLLAGLIYKVRQWFQGKKAARRTDIANRAGIVNPFALQQINRGNNTGDRPFDYYGNQSNTDYEQNVGGDGYEQAVTENPNYRMTNDANSRRTGSDGYEANPGDIVEYAEGEGNDVPAVRNSGAARANNGQTNYSLGDELAFVPARTVVSTNNQSSEYLTPFTHNPVYVSSDERQGNYNNTASEDDELFVDAIDFTTETPIRLNNQTANNSEYDTVDTSVEQSRRGYIDVRADAE